MNEPVAFYPWLVNWRTVSEVLLGGMVGVVFLYLWLRTGRDYSDEPKTTEERPMHSYAGDTIHESSHRTPVFLVFFSVIISLIALCYVINCIFQGGIDY